MTRRKVILAILTGVVAVATAFVINLVTGGTVAGQTVSGEIVWPLFGGLILVTLGLAVWQLKEDGAPNDLSKVLLDDERLELVLARLRGSSADTKRPRREVSSTGFVGREAEIESALLVLRSTESPSLISIYGKPGVGKTALAKRIASAASSYYSDGSVLLSMRGLDREPASASEIALLIMREISDVHLADTTDNATVREELQKFFAARAVLVVLDNAASSGQVDALVPRSGASAVIVTSRRPLGLINSDRVVPLGLLSPVEAVDLIELKIRASVSSVTKAAGGVDAETLADLCGYLPLAINIACSILSSRPGWSIDYLNSRLADETKRLRRLRADDVEVAASFELSYQNLSPEEARAFRSLGLINLESYSTSIAAAAIGENSERVDELLQGLTDAQLVDSREGSIWSFHDLIRLYGRERALKGDTYAMRSATVRRVAESASSSSVVASVLYGGAGVESTTDSADREVRRGAVLLTVGELQKRDAFQSLSGLMAIEKPTPDSTALLWYETWLPNLLAILELCREYALHQQYLSLADSLRRFLLATARYNIAQSISRHAVESARVLGDRAEENRALYGQCLAMRHSERKAETISLLEQVVSAAKAGGDEVTEADASYTLGQALREDERPEEATRYFTNAAQKRQSARAVVKSAEGELAIVLKDQGRYRDAETLMEAALRESALAPMTLNNYRATGWMIENLGAIKKRLGKVEEALSAHVDSFARFYFVGDRMGQAFAARNLGDLLTMASLPDLAEEFYRASLEVFIELNDRGGHAQASVSLGVLELRRRRYHRSFAHFARAIQLRGLRYTYKFGRRMLILAMGPGVRTLQRSAIE